MLPPESSNRSMPASYLWRSQMDPSPAKAIVYGLSVRRPSVRRCSCHWPSLRLHKASPLLTQIVPRESSRTFHALRPNAAGVSTRATRSERQGCSFRNKPHVVGSHKRPCRSTNRSSGSQASPSLGLVRRTLPEAGSILANPPGLAAAHMEPSELSASQRTLSPPKPSFLFQFLIRPELSMRATPKLVPTHKAPFRSRLMFQTISEGSPCSIFQASHEPLPSHRARPPPARPIQTDPSRSSSTATVFSLRRPCCRFTSFHPCLPRIARPWSVGTMTDASRVNATAPQNPLDPISAFSWENLTCPGALE